MSLEDWEGYARLLQPNHEASMDKWLHFVSQETPEYMEEHQEAVEQVEEDFQAYMMAYGIEAENLVNPTVKYDANGLVK